MSSSPVVSVVIVHWNRRELLEACFKSLKHQDFQEFETIIVDNGSSDGSQDLLRGWAAEGRVKLIENVSNQGFCRANNQGIAAASGRYVALLNNDAEAEPGWLGELLRAAEQDERIGMVASKILRADARDTIDKVGHLIYADGQNRGRGTGEVDRGQYDADSDVAWPDGCAALYRRAMLDEIGGFDEDFFAYADDAELGLRARIAGWGAVYSPQAVVYHRIGMTLGRYSYRRLYLIERNRFWLVAKLYPKRLWPMTPIYSLIRLLAVAAAMTRSNSEANRAVHEVSLLGLLKCLIRANLDALAGLPRMVRKRQEVDRIRKISPSDVVGLLRRYRLSLSQTAFISH